LFQPDDFLVSKVNVMEIPPNSEQYAKILKNMGIFMNSIHFIKQNLRTKPNLSLMKDQGGDKFLQIFEALAMNNMN
jgi:hypothetical protein